jgi:hypothetical protein
MKTQRSIYIEEDAWRKFRKVCIDKGKTASGIIEEFINDTIKNKK